MEKIEQFLVEFAKKHQFEGVFENELRKQLVDFHRDSSLEFNISKFFNNSKDLKSFVTHSLLINNISVLVKPKLIPQINEDTPFLEFNAYYFYCLNH